MVTLNRIYTRTGDKGDTRLADGQTRPKFDLRVEAYGTVDEANACLGLARLHTAREHPAIDAMLSRIQNDLFDLGADLATPESKEPPKYEPLRIVQSQVDWLERAIDELNENIPALKSFILPGGGASSAALHLARTVSRRAERLMVQLSREPDEKVGEAALKYINRLSDFLFVAGRAVNDNGARDVLWVPGKNR